MSDDPDDPNEAYTVHPIPDDGGFPRGGWRVDRNGVPWRYYAQDDRTEADRYVSDPAYRKSLVTKKDWEQ
jgi:hypothetical protein